MDAFGVLDGVLGDYQAFVEGFLNIQDEQVKAKVDAEIADGLLWPEPWLACTIIGEIKKRRSPCRASPTGASRLGRSGLARR